LLFIYYVHFVFPQIVYKHRKHRNSTGELSHLLVKLENQRYDRECQAN